MDQTNLVSAATQELYVAEPDVFVARRAELARQARAAGAKDEAKAIAALRKPQRSAYVLNRYAQARPEQIESLLHMGADLRKAERELDGPALRSLSAARRRLVAAMVSDALKISGQSAPSSALHEELTGTLNAAIADEQVAAHLQRGTLSQPAQWSGFGSGFESGSPPHLTLVPPPTATAAATSASTTKASTATGTTAPNTRAQPTTTRTTDDRGSSAAQARKEREARARQERDAEVRSAAETARSRAEAARSKRQEAVARADAELNEADEALEQAETWVRTERQHIKDLTAELEQARKRLRDNESDQRDAQRAQRAARVAAERIKRRLSSD